MALSLAPGVFFGRRVAERRTQHLALVQTSYERGAELPTHVHERAYLVVVLCGGFRERLGAREELAGEGALLLNLAQAEHSDRFEAERSEVLNVELDPSWIEAFESEACGARRARRPEFVDGRRFLTRIRAAGVHLEHPEPLSSIVLEGLCAELVGYAWAAAPRESADEGVWLARLEARLAEDFRRPPGLLELARETGRSPNRLARAFRARTGLSIGAWLRRRRAEHARSRVLGSRASLSEIALEAGYADQSHMTREFRRVLGCTPGELRV